MNKQSSILFDSPSMTGMPSVLSLLLVKTSPTYVLAGDGVIATRFYCVFGDLVKINHASPNHRTHLLHVVGHASIFAAWLFRESQPLIAVCFLFTSLPGAHNLNEGSARKVPRETSASACPRQRFLVSSIPKS